MFSFSARDTIEVMKPCDPRLSPASADGAESGLGALNPFKDLERDSYRPFLFAISSIRTLLHMTVSSHSHWG